MVRHEKHVMLCKTTMPKPNPNTLMARNTQHTTHNTQHTTHIRSSDQENYALITSRTHSHTHPFFGQMFLEQIVVVSYI